MTATLEGGEWSAARPGRTLHPGKTRYPFYRRLDWPQGRSGWAENLVPTGIRSRTVQPVSQSLYRRSHLAHTMTVGQKINLHFICFRVFISTYSMNSLTRMEDRVWWGDIREGDHLEDAGVDCRILKWILKEWDDQAWFTIGTDGGLL